MYKKRNKVIIEEVDALGNTSTGKSGTTEEKSTTEGKVNRDNPILQVDSTGSTSIVPMKIENASPKVETPTALGGASTGLLPFDKTNKYTNGGKPTNGSVSTGTGAGGGTTASGTNSASGASGVGTSGVGTSGVGTSGANTVKAGYESLYAPKGMTNDGMSGWRSQLGAMNDKYGGDILGYANTEEFAALDAQAKAQYYEDLANYKALYSTVSGYDSQYIQQEKNAKRAEEYANTRRALMERYLPETLSAMGYANTGVAGDALLKMNNAYDNYALSARETAVQNQSDALAKYQEAARKYEAERDEEKRLEYEEEYETEEAEAKAKAEEQQANFDAYKAKLTTDGNIDWNQAATDVSTGALTQEQYDELKKIYVNSSTSSKVSDVVAKDVADAVGLDASKFKSAKAVDPYSDAETFVKDLDVSQGSKQTAFVKRVFEASRGWGADRNGTIVDFNYGASVAPALYVFYNGLWYDISKYSVKELRKSGKIVYVEGQGEDPENSFYNVFGE